MSYYYNFNEDLILKNLQHLFGNYENLNNYLKKENFDEKTFKKIMHLSMFKQYRALYTHKEYYNSLDAAIDGALEKFC